jgi:guanyl-specific ribonuclease Sa
MDWVGCQVSNPSDATGPGSALTEPEISEVPSPVGGTVSMVTIPDPQSAIVVVCDTGTPFIYEDQGAWIGCQG